MLKYLATKVDNTWVSCLFLLQHTDGSVKIFSSSVTSNNVCDTLLPCQTETTRGKACGDF